MKYFSIVILIILSLLTACSNEEKGDAIIKEAELTDFEKSLMEIAGKESFAFDIELNNENVEEVHTKIDYYENGEFIDSLSEFSSALSESDLKETIRAVFIRQEITDQEEQWISSVITADGSGSSTIKNKIADSEEMSSAWGGIPSSASLNIGEKRIIASIVHSNRNQVSVLNSIETEADIKRATDYERAYLISIELK